MLITKTPFRISFCGGGSDMAAFYSRHGGCVLSTTINKYMYLSIHPYFDPELTALKYSQTEIVDSLDKVEHRIFKQVLGDFGVSGVEIVSTADVPAGTGLGSSSSFTVGLLHTLYAYTGKFAAKERLAREACEVEIEKLGAPIGKQDQYAAAFGGLNFITFHPDGAVSVEPIITRPETYRELQDSLILFYTGITHDANEILREQRDSVTEADKSENLKRMCGLARDMKSSLELGDLSGFGRILNESWRLKKSLAGGITGPEIDALYDTALQNGALGGKLLGAGGGGFLLFCCAPENRQRLSRALGLRELDFRFEHDGTSVIYIGDKYWSL